jgi:hypothetical protein
MTIRIVSQEQIRFDVDVETYNRIIRDVTAKVTEACQDSITRMIATGLSNDVMESFHENLDMSTIAQYVASSLNYGRIVDFGRTQLIDALLGDERFNTLLNRGITRSTMGVIDETVERVTAHVLTEMGKETDV